MACARQILSTPNQNIEVVIRDCGDAAGLAEEVAAINDRRLIYHNAPPVSMTENWNRAVAMASGEYVCIIGDDDGLSPTIIPVVEWASTVHADAVVFPYAAVYYWPDFPSAKYAGRLFLGTCSGEIRRFPARQQLSDYMRVATSVVLPRVYHGVVRRECLEALKRKTGEYFHSAALDDYLSYALSLMIGEFYYVDLPLTIAGKCGTSNSGRHAQSGTASAHLSAYGAKDRLLDRRCPPTAKAYSLRIQAMITAFEYSGAGELIDTMVDGQRYASWYALSLRMNFFDALRSARHLWVRALEGRKLGDKLGIVAKVGRECFAHGVSKMRRHVVEAKGGYSSMISGSNRQSMHPARDIGEAVAILEREVGNRRSEFAEAIAQANEKRSRAIPLSAN